MTIDLIDSIFSLEKECFDINFSRKTIEDMLKDKRYKFFFNFENDKLNGYIIVLEMVDVYEIIRIAVNLNYRNQGIATKLIERSIDFFKDKKVNLIFLEVRKRNEKAKNLYKKIGFKEVSIRKKYYKDDNDDAIVMKLELL